MMAVSNCDPTLMRSNTGLMWWWRWGSTFMGYGDDSAKEEIQGDDKDPIFILDGNVGEEGIGGSWQA